MFTASLWKRVPGQCLMDARLKPRCMKANSLITSHLGFLMKNKRIQTRTVTPSCWDRSCPTTIPEVSEPSGSKLFIGKHVGEDNERDCVNEIVSYIVIEAGHTTSNGIEIETRRGSNTAVSYVDRVGSDYTFSTPFSTTPAVAVLSQVAMDGGDVSWDVLAEVTLQNSMKVAVDEDHLADGDNSHTYKQLDYIVFSTTGPLPLV